MQKLRSWVKKHYPKSLPILLIFGVLLTWGDKVVKLIDAANTVDTAVANAQKHEEERQTVTAVLTNGDFQLPSADFLAVSFDNPTGRTEGIDNVLFECSKRDGTRVFMTPVNDDPLPGEGRGLELMPIAIPAGVPRKVQFVLRKTPVLEPSRDCASLRVAWTDSDRKQHFGDPLELEPNEVVFGNMVLNRSWTDSDPQRGRMPPLVGANSY